MPRPKSTPETRTRPVFEQLYAEDSTGVSWLAPLAGLGSRVPELELPEGALEGGSLQQPPQFDYTVPPLLEYLEYLVKNPKRLKWPLDADGQPRQYRPSVHQKRKALMAGSVPAQQEAIRQIRQEQARKTPADINTKHWWVLEGETTIDVALFAEGVTLFIEAKRDERSLKVHTNWYERRVQIYRNLDSLRALSNRAERYYLLALVEEGTPVHKEAVGMHRDYQFARSSWPHLDNDAAAELWTHFLGFATWQQVAAAFPAIGLPE